MRTHLPASPAPKMAPRRPRAPRSDGSSTRLHILENAGELYAENGYSRTTSKEICARAGTNMAAVNYHFGSKDGLYAAVLVEAHRRLVSLEDLEAIADNGAPPMEQFATVLRRYLQPPASAARPAWALRVLVQEMMAPSPHIPVLLRKAVLPKVQVLFGLVARVLDVEARHPVVQRAIAFAVVPCIVLLVAPRPLRAEVLPALEDDPLATLDDMVAYALAGLQALRDRWSPPEPIASAYDGSRTALLPCCHPPKPSEE